MPDVGLRGRRDKEDDDVHWVIGGVLAHAGGTSEAHGPNSNNGDGLLTNGQRKDSYYYNSNCLSLSSKIVEIWMLINPLLCMTGPYQV